MKVSVEWRITLYPLFLRQNLSAADILCQNFTDVIQPEKYLRKLEPVLDAKEQSWCREPESLLDIGEGYLTCLHEKQKPKL